MRKLIFIVLLALPLISYAQEEFLENDGGLSLAYSYSFMPDVDDLTSIGVAARSRNGFTFATQFAKYDEYLSPSIGIAYFTAPREKNNYLSATFGFTYTYIDSQSLFGIACGPMAYFNAKNQFPTSIHALLLYSFDITPSNDEYGVITDTYVSIGTGIHQAFFSDATVFPYLCFNTSISPTYSYFSEKRYRILYSLSIGFNINLAK